MDMQKFFGYETGAKNSYPLTSGENIAECKRHQAIQMNLTKIYLYV